MISPYRGDSNDTRASASGESRDVDECREGDVLARLPGAGSQVRPSKAMCNLSIEMTKWQYMVGD